MRRAAGPIEHLLRSCLLLPVAVVLAACASGRVMMPPPALYTQGVVAPFEDLDAALQSAEVDVMYATDRVPEPRPDGEFGYGVERSSSVSFGSAVVRIGDGLSWPELAAAARAEATGRPPALTMLSVREQTRAPATPLPWTMVDGRPVTLPEVAAKNDATAAEFCAELERRLAQTRHKDALVYVHGVQNTFEDSVVTVAELWHFMGREGVPMVFSWPAGRGGLLRGYTYDRESGEFAGFHFKQFLTILAGCESLERINIIAHSRGTDVTLTALREMTIAERAAGRDPLRTLRLHNVVLAAPDLDLGVTMQRVSSERVGASLHRLTVYTSPLDKAISLSEMLFGGLVRLGQLDSVSIREQYPDYVPPSAESPAGAGIVAFIEYSGSRGGAHGHGYFRENPAVSSDMVLAVRFDREPGAQNGRPLRHLDGFFWSIDDEYLHESAD